MNPAVYLVVCLSAFQGISGAHGSLSMGDPEDDRARHLTPVFLYSVFDSNGSPNVHCGLYSLFAAARVLDVTIPLEELFDSKYLSIEGGSSTRQLSDAAADYGLQALPFSSMCLEQLEQIKTPTILLLETARGRPGHWVCWLGNRQNKMVVYDSVTGINLVERYELSCLWGGQGIQILATKSGQLLSHDFVSQLQRATLLWFPVFLILLATLTSKVKTLEYLFPNRHAAFSASTTYFLLFSAAVWSLIQVSINPDHIVRHRQVAKLMNCHLKSTEHVSSIDLPFSSSVEKFQLVDARRPAAFLNKQLSGAINIPFDCNSFEFNRFVSELDPKISCLVYCQNDDCGWAANLASQLRCAGFNTSILQGGIEKYSSVASADATQGASRRLFSNDF